MRLMINKRQGRTHNVFLISVYVLVFFLLCPDELQAQNKGKKTARRHDRRRAKREAENAAKDFKRHIYDVVLADHVSLNQPIAQADISLIKNSDPFKKVNQYMGQLSDQNKAMVYVVGAFLAHYAGDEEDQVIRLAQKAYDADENDPEVNDTLVTLSLYYGRYDLARKVLRANEAGRDVILGKKEFLARERAHLGKKSRQVRSTKPKVPGMMPGMMPPARSQDPNTGSSSSKTSSSFSHLKKKKDSDSISRSGRRPGSRPSPGNPGEIPGLMPGMMGQIPGRSPSKRKTGRAAKRTGQSKLQLPLEFMPYELIGQSLDALNLSNTNGTVATFETGKGQVLCALVWTLPGDSGNRSRSSKDDELGIQKVEADFWANLDQFRDWYRHYLNSGKVHFLGINLNSPRAQLNQKITDIFAETPWPWANCMADMPANKSQLPFREKVDHMLMMVDTQGKIMYTGPVGGYLPRLLLEKEISVAVPDSRMAFPNLPYQVYDPNAIPAKSVKRSQASMKVARIESAEIDKTPTEPSAVDRREDDDAESELADDIQAERLMELARVQKRMSPRNALKHYDEVLERFPHTIQAKRAKVKIRSILRSKPRLRKEREQEGKYVGG